MINDIVQFTNMEAQARRGEGAAPYVYQEWIDTFPEEMYAYIGLLIAPGVHRSNDMDLRDLWNENRGRPFFARQWDESGSS